MTQLPEAEKALPEILVEEDTPLFKTADDGNADKTLSKETPTNQPMDVKKFLLGSSTLGWCIFLMLLCIILSLWFPDNELVKSGFEAFKLIVMTILGYIFGSNNSKTNN